MEEDVHDRHEAVRSGRQARVASADVGRHEPVAAGTECGLEALDCGRYQIAAIDAGYTQAHARRGPSSRCPAPTSKTTFDAVERVMPADEPADAALQGL